MMCNDICHIIDNHHKTIMFVTHLCPIYIKTIFFFFVRCTQYTLVLRFTTSFLKRDKSKTTNYNSHLSSANYSKNTIKPWLQSPRIRRRVPVPSLLLPSRTARPVPNPAVVALGTFFSKREIYIYIYMKTCVFCYICQG